MQEEHLEQRELGGTELELALASTHVIRNWVEDEVGVAEDARRGLGRRAAEERADTGEQLLDGKRLAQIVVGAGLEPVDPVGHGDKRGQHEDGRAVAACAHPAQHLEPVGRRHRHVEHDKRELPGRERIQGSPPAPGEYDLVVGESEHALERPLKHRVVVYD